MTKNKTLRNLLESKHLGLALSGGGARGFAHIGVLMVLEEKKLKPKFVSGTSIGGIIGALYCTGKSWEEIYDIVKKLSWAKLFDFSLRGGLVGGEALIKILQGILPARFEDLKIPLSVPATDIETGQEYVFSRGDLATALRASSSLPAIFTPYQFEDKYLIDGGIVNNVPSTLVKAMGADRIIAVDVGPPSDRKTGIEDDENFWKKIISTVKLEKRGLTVDILLKSIDIMQSRLSSMISAAIDPDLFLRIPMPHINIESFHKLEDAVKAGEEEALRSLGSRV